MFSVKRKIIRICNCLLRIHSFVFSSTTDPVPVIIISLCCKANRTTQSQNFFFSLNTDYVKKYFK